MYILQQLGYVNAHMQNVRKNSVHTTHTEHHCSYRWHIYAAVNKKAFSFFPPNVAVKQAQQRSNIKSNPAMPAATTVPVLQLGHQHKSFDGA